MVPEKTKALLGRAVKTAVVASAVVAGAAFADGGDVASNITTIQTQTVANIALVVTAAFAVLVASLVPDIGLGLAKKWIKKGAS